MNISLGCFAYCDEFQKQCCKCVHLLSCDKLRRRVLRLLEKKCSKLKTKYNVSHRRVHGQLVFILIRW